MNIKSLALLMTVSVAFLAPMVAEANCNHCGRIKRLEPYTTSGNKTGGAVAGAVVGGLLGNQIGKGDGRKVATVAGAAGGAYAGKKIAQNSERTRWRITIRMDDGDVETVDQGSSKNLHVGDYVKVRDGKAYRL
ncbi:MAG: glycine zipper 2TM domain-containing protein [Arenimonas sp.]